MDLCVATGGSLGGSVSPLCATMVRESAADFYLARSLRRAITSDAERR